LKVDLHIKKDSNSNYKFFFRTNKEFYEIRKTKTVVSNFTYSLGSHLFEPKYDIAIIDENTYRILVDIPGEYEIQTGVSDKDPEIILRGEKILSFQDGEKKTTYAADKAYYQTREFGIFEIRIPLVSGFEKAGLTNVKRTRKNGHFELLVEKPGNVGGFEKD